jgi:hypothetical protein
MDAVYFPIGIESRCFANIFIVMPGLVPGIHVLAQKKAWMAGTSPAMTRKEIQSGQQLA